MGIDISKAVMGRALDLCKGYFKYIDVDNILAELSEQDERYEKAINTITRVLESADALENTESSDTMISTRALITFTLAVIGKTSAGKSVKEFDRQDWEDILVEVDDKALKLSASEFSVLVFDQYIRVIEISSKILEAKASESTIQSLNEDIGILNSLKDSFHNEEISEVKYTEEALWTCLDAVFKIMTAYLSVPLGLNEQEERMQIVATLAFQSLRLKLYTEERDVLDDCLNRASKVNDELKAKLAAYIDSLNAETDRFDALIDKAFDSDFRTAFSGSAELARAYGISESEIITSIAEVDDFFLD